MIWPNNKKFAFTIIDDTDGGFVYNTEPVYKLLFDCNMRITKTVWVYPPRDEFEGGCLLDAEYRDFIKDLQHKGFEIALHNVGSGLFGREEIKAGLEIFKKIIGSYPKIHINHANNADNIYWGIERHSPFVKAIINSMYGDRRRYKGSKKDSDQFWGDLCKEHIKYIRNHVFSDINTLKNDPRMPYRVKSKDEFSNYWFSASNGYTVEEFNDLVNPDSIDKLEEEGGVCIVYTHFSCDFVDENGELDPSFERNIRYLSNKGGWFVPASELLDFMLAKKDSDEDFASELYLQALDLKWIVDRAIKKIEYGR